MTVKELLHVLQQEKYDLKDYQVTISTGDTATAKIATIERDDETREVVITLEAEKES